VSKGEDSDREHSEREDSATLARFVTMFTLIVAGEVVFFLPFVLPRVFRPTLLDVFEITNFELGVAFSIYGVVAMIAYAPSGPLADRFLPRTLMAIALAGTSLGGFIATTLPSLDGLKTLYGFWGLTTILLFWAPLIRATRHWGGQQLPGRAFGLLDGGRGLIAALIASLSVYLFAALMPAEVQTASPQQRADAFRQVILLFSVVTLAAAVLVWFALPRERNAEAERTSETRADTTLRSRFWLVLRMPTVWLQAAIVVCAYVAYKGLDDVSLYAQVVLGFDEVQAAGVGTVSLWVRPFAAIAAGVLADRFGVVRMTAISFAMIVAGAVLLALGWIQPGRFAIFLATLIPTSAAIFALRGLYFAIMEEGRVPIHATGSAVGIVSVIGYTPDVFMGPLMGYLLDRTPGPAGHQHLFWVIAGFGCVGFAATRLFRRAAESS
jgi:sugar phosphate permease